MDVHEFVRRWSSSTLREQQAAQSHFNELCRLVGRPTPTEFDPTGDTFTFERHVTKSSGQAGRADVWFKDHFAWEYKGKHRDLETAYTQILSYRGDLGNPPLLVVCDFDEYRIYPQWPNLSGRPFTFRNADLLKPGGLDPIRWLLTDPDAFRRQREAEQEARARITDVQAKKFAELAQLMREYRGADGKAAWTPMQIARFLTKLVFALFAEDIGLLPRIEQQTVFTYLIEQGTKNRAAFRTSLQDLFRAMDGKQNHFLMQHIPYFNGGLFADSTAGAGDGHEVLDIATPKDLAPAMEVLRETVSADWREVNPTIFGTLFERALDPGKRAQLGAHYTSEADIRLIVEPVLMEPLYREWDGIRAEAEPLLQAYLKADTPPAERAETVERLKRLRGTMLDRLGTIRVLDPACGSGNFLYVSLRALKDLEARVHDLFAPLRLPFRDVVTPRQLYGIEKDEFASKLAQVVVWIGYLQWRYEHAGGSLILAQPGAEVSDPRELTVPILKDKDSRDEPPRIVCDDAIMRYDAAGKPYEPEWPRADVIMGNPPFLGGKRLRSELKDKYVDELFRVYSDRVPREADLVCYWFEKARAHIEAKQGQRAGLLATNSIRGGANRTVLENIKRTGDIFMAWDDREWTLDGAAVRVSLIGFDSRAAETRCLNGDVVTEIYADLTSRVDITGAPKLVENSNLSFMGVTPAGPFEIPYEVAQNMLQVKNRSGLHNGDVVKPISNAIDVTRRSRNAWTIDFGVDLAEPDAEKYELPYGYVKEAVRPKRLASKQPEHEKAKWWIFTRPRPEMRQAVSEIRRYIVTPAVAKHRLFTWLDREIVPDHALIVVARDDDYFFGALHAYPHEIWSLRMGTSLEDRPRYTPTTTFETFPFPWSPGSEPTNDARHAAIAAAARQLHEERDAWLNPADQMGASLRDRTLTKLYNALEDYRAWKRDGNSAWVPSDHARGFAPRLYELHEALDAAVLAAYGWDDLNGKLRTPDGDEELLRRLLALNLARGG